MCHHENNRYVMLIGQSALNAIMIDILLSRKCSGGHFKRQADIWSHTFFCHSLPSRANAQNQITCRIDHDWLDDAAKVVYRKR